MSINITDKNGDTVEILIENTNQAIETVNNQLDVSVLANLKTTVKDTLVNAINELYGTKLDNNANGVPNDFKVNGLLEVESIKINLDEDGNSTIWFYDSTDEMYVKLFWNNSLRNWQLSYPDGKVLTIANNEDIENLQNQIDNIASTLNFNFNNNGNTLIIKYMSGELVNQYVGVAGEIVINSDNFDEMRILDGVTPGGSVISGATIIDWKPYYTIKKNQCVLYGNSLYRAIETHKTDDKFDISLYLPIASYKKYTETLYIEEATDTIQLGRTIRNKSDLDINIGGLITQKSKYTILDEQHIQFDSIIPINTDIEITYYDAAVLHNSTTMINVFVAEEDGTTIIPLSEKVDNKTLIYEVNIENTSIMNSEWELGEGNYNLILKNPISAGTRVQIKFWKGIVVAQNGITYTPYIIDDVLYWRNDGGFTNPNPISIVTRNTKQTIHGPKIFEDIYVKELDVLDNSSKAASTSFVINHEKIHRSNCLNKITSHMDVHLNNGKICVLSESNIFYPSSEGFVKSRCENNLEFIPTENNTTQLLFVDQDFNFVSSNINNIYVSKTTPTGELNMVWYDIKNQDIKYTIDGGIIWTSCLSLPICQYTINEGNVKLDHIFNNLGVIKNRLFVLPGFNGLIADGWKLSGFPNNIEFTNDQVIIKDFTNESGMFDIVLNDSEIGIDNVYYDLTSNQLHNINHEIVNGVKIGYIEIQNGQIQNIRLENPFRPVSCSDRSWIAKQSLPSTKYIDFELRESGSTYIAPSHGYFILNMKSSEVNQYVHLETQECEGFATRQYSVGVDNLITCKHHIAAGQTLYVEYTANELDKFRFFYDEGMN